MLTYRLSNYSGEYYLTPIVGVTVLPSQTPEDVVRVTSNINRVSLQEKIIKKHVANYVLIVPEIVDIASYNFIKNKLSRHREGNPVSYETPYVNGKSQGTYAVLVHLENETPQAEYLPFFQSIDNSLNLEYWTYNEALQIVYYGPKPHGNQKLRLPLIDGAYLNTNGQVVHKKIKTPSNSIESLPTVLQQNSVFKQPVSNVSNHAIDASKSLSQTEIDNIPYNNAQGSVVEVTKDSEFNKNLPAYRLEPLPVNNNISRSEIAREESKTLIVAPADSTIRTGLETQNNNRIKQIKNNSPSSRSGNSSKPSLLDGSRLKPLVYSGIAIITLGLFGLMCWNVNNSRGDRDTIDRSQTNSSVIEKDKNKQATQIKDLESSIEGLKEQNSKIAALNKQIDELNDQVLELKSSKKAKVLQEQDSVIKKRSDYQEELTALQQETIKQAEATRRFIETNSPTKKDLEKLGSQFEKESERLSTSFNDTKGLINDVDKNLKTLSNKFDTFKDSLNISEPELDKIKNQAKSASKKVESVFKDVIKSINK